MKQANSFSSHLAPTGNPNLNTPWSRDRHGCDPPASSHEDSFSYFTCLRTTGFFPCLSTDFPQIRFPSVVFNSLLARIPNLVSGHGRGLTTALESNRKLHTACLVFVCLLLNLGTFSSTAMAAEEPESSASGNTLLIPLMVHLDQSLHFSAPDGKTVVVSPGTYLIEPITQGEPRLAFWHEHGRVTLQATRTTHAQQLKNPEAYLIQEHDNEDIHHVVVFIPDGTALEATGSVSGIQTRGNFRVTRHYQLDATTGVVRFGNGLQGRQLPTGSNLSAQYRNGLGSQGGAELSMIELQSLISQRALALQLTTSLLNTLHGQFQLEEAIDRPGNDYVRHMGGSPEACRTRCAGDGNCQAFTFVKPNPGVAQGQCFLKRSEPQPVANPCCVSGTRSSTEQKIIRNIGH